MQTQKRLAMIVALTGSLVCSACTAPGPGNAPRPQFVPPPISGPGQKKYAPPPQFVIPPARPEELSAAGLPMPPPIFIPKPTKAKAKIKAKKSPVKFEKKKIDGIPFYLTTIDLTDEATYLSLLLPNDAPTANDANTTYGAEDFNKYVKDHHGAVLMNGTFFSKDSQQRVMGNVVADGKMLKYSQWENYGTTLGIRAGNKLEMVTARGEGQPEWDKHWFSLTCGPRLLRQGKVWLFPELEGFKDSHVFTIGPRQAIGFPASGERIYLVTFLLGLSLEKEADLMKKIGCSEAMNLDGGASRALAHNGQIIVKAGRPLTNVLIVYDCKYPAPGAVSQSWQNFQQKFGESAVPVSIDP